MGGVHGQVVPRTIAENSGLNATEVVALLHAAHANGQSSAGVDIETGQPRDLSTDGIVDIYSTKWYVCQDQPTSRLCMHRPGIRLGSQLPISDGCPTPPEIAIYLVLLHEQSHCPWMMQISC